MTRRSDLDALAAQAAGRRVPGGCEDCDAYQTFYFADGIYHLRTHHDATCPWLTGATR